MIFNQKMYDALVATEQYVNVPLRNYAGGLIYYVLIPKPPVRWPEVIVWAGRTFIHKGVLDQSIPPDYREVHAYTVCQIGGVTDNNLTTRSP